MSAALIDKVNVNTRKGRSLAMPNSKNKDKKELRKAIGAVLSAPVVAPLIVLSGFVPMPLMIQSARAGSTTLQVSRAFITGHSVGHTHGPKSG